MTRVKGSTWGTLENLGYISMGDIAIGDGVTDNTVAFNTALATGMPILIPVGTFIISGAVIPNDTILFGTGNKSILKLKQLSNTTVLTVGSNCQLSNFLIDGNKLNQVSIGCDGIKFVSSIESTATSVYALNCKGSGFKVTGISTSNVILNLCSSKGHTEHGVLVNGGSNISILAHSVFSPDALSIGSGISIASDGTPITNVTITAPTVLYSLGAGILVSGNGSKNVTCVTITAPKVSNSSLHGIQFINAANSSLFGGSSTLNTLDGCRLEGDVQNLRITGLCASSNSGVGIREVTAGATPNFNGLIYCISVLNSNNIITKVGANSYVV